MLLHLRYLLVLLTIGLSGIAYAQNFTVDDSGDGSDSTPGDGVCETGLGNGICTLRAAIEEASADGVANTIDFSLTSGTVINISTELLVDDDDTFIDADLDADGIPDIVINSGASNINGFHITSADNTIQGFNFVDFQGVGTNAPIQIDGATASGNTITSNYIGTDLGGDIVSATPNFRSLRIVNGATGNFIGNGTIQGRNLVSGNTFGIYINGSDDNQIAGNIIGLDQTGLVDLGNGDIGIEVISSSGTIIGSADEGLNVISGNSQQGIYLSAAINTVMVNNYIGTNILADAIIANGAGRSGIHLISASNDCEIGDGTLSGRNIISGNGAQGGVFVEGSTGNSILGNYIGVGADGVIDLGNSGYGIRFGVGATSNFIGDGTVGGGNVIAGNGGHEILIGAGPNTVLGNNIGIDATGSTIVNATAAGIGISIVNGADANIIGNGTTDGRNTIAGNTNGINIASDDNVILGNYIGLSSDGLFARANTGDGITISGTAANNTIGGDRSIGEGNVISGNGGHGITIDSDGNNVYGNIIGLSSSGIFNRSNTDAGIYVTGDNTNIGDAVTNYENIISANDYGVHIFSGDNTTILGNVIGLNPSGIGDKGNTNDGIYILGTITSTTIGDGTSLGANYISGNNTGGIRVSGPGVSGVAIDYNFLGVEIDEVTARGNTGNGITLQLSSSGTLIDNSVIANNSAHGIDIATSSINNIYTSNSIYNNTNKGINNGVSAPNLAVVSGLAMDGTISGTCSSTASSVDIFFDAGDEGQTFLVTVVPSTGAWSYVADLQNDFPSGQYNITATQLDLGYTSDFSSPYDYSADFDPYIVTNTNDAGVGSLRWCIENANLSSGETILFAISGSAPHTISPASALPAITSNTIIDATTQTGFDFSTGAMVTIDGGGTLSPGLDLDATVEVYGMRITSFNGTGIHVQSSFCIIGASGKGNVIVNNDNGIGMFLNSTGNITMAYNHIGIEGDGVTLNGNAGDGISFPGDQDDNIVEYNLISGNDNGIQTNTASGDVFRFNYIGTDISGILARPNTANGIRIGTGNSHTINDNLISGNTGNGISFVSSSNHIIENNLIGVQADGTTALGNGGHGLALDVGSPSGMTIGGTGTGNIIAFNTGNAFNISGAGANSNDILENSIYCNGGGIVLSSSAQADIQPPVISTFTTTDVSGTGVDGDIIRVYRDNSGCVPQQGQEYLGTTTVAGGVWTLGGLTLLLTDVMNSTATDASGNTSEFSNIYPESYFVVVNTNDSGIGSLRSAIDYSNLVNGHNITFNIPNTDGNYFNTAGDERWTISPVTELPDITEQTIIDATTQPGTGDYRIKIAGQGALDDGFYAIAQTEIYGFLIEGFSLNAGSTAIHLMNGSSNSIVGDVNKGNVIINNSRGITLWLADNLTVKSNLIGTDETGTTAIANTVGIYTESASLNNIIGGSLATERNLISGNSSYGIQMRSGSQTIEGNYIGTDITGLLAIPNGVGILVSSTTNQILDNTISGNTGAGIQLSNASNTIQGNYIGVGSDGSSAVSNGIGIETNSAWQADNNLIGGTGVGEGNVIANNTNQGVYIDHADADFNQIIGNRIYCNGSRGIDLNLGSATSAFGNNAISEPVITTVINGSISGTGVNGDVIHVYRDNSGCVPTIGADEYLGNTTVAGGVWTLNDGSILATDQMNATATDVSGNTSQFVNNFPDDWFTVINTNDTGIGSLREAINRANSQTLPPTIEFNIPGVGPWIINLVSALPDVIMDNVVIDGTTQPSWDMDAGLMVTIDGSSLAGSENGIFIDALDVAVYGLQVSNFPGSGIRVNLFASNAIIGSISKGNVINGNASTGVAVGWTGGIISGNRIGTNAQGDSALPNGRGIAPYSTTVITNNLISGNTIHGIFDNTGNNLIIQDNLIGTDITGSTALSNNVGIYLATSSGHTVVDNVISGNTFAGMQFSLTSSSTVQGNMIGVGLNGTDPIGNGMGIYTWASTSSDDNIIGGTLAGEANIIAHNVDQGVLIEGTNHDFNQIIGNSIFCNGGKGIDLNGAGNDNKAPPEIASIGVGTVSGIGTDGDVIHVYQDNAGCGSLQGEEYLGTTTVAGGVWTVPEGSILATDYITATATDVSGNTSEFAAGPYIVTNTNDSGNGSLRWAITNANASSGETIEFKISNSDANYNLDGGTGDETWTITPLTDLPTISVAVILDATTQSGTGNFRIVLDGTTTAGHGLIYSAGGSEIYGFYITEFNAGIALSYAGGGVTIGDIGKGNTIVNCTNGIGGIISSAHVIKGNYIGTDENGTMGIGNANRGLDFGNSSPNLIIGGSVAGEGNVISGNGGSGIYINVCGNSQIVGNYFGTDPTGLIAIPNASGVYLGNSGGSQVIDNVISGNTGDGISFNASSNCTIQGNYIGVGSDGTTAIANGIGIHGFTISSSSDNTIGGTGIGEPNIIAHNVNQGILFEDANHINNQFIANSMFCNLGKGIDLNGVANGGILPPVITTFDISSIVGTSVEANGAVIRIYEADESCSGNQGFTYVGQTTVGSNTWSLAGSINITKPHVATVTDITNGSSEFSTEIENNAFITTWITDNNQITIPTNSGSYTYNYDIVWNNLTNSGVGDGSITGQTGDYIITGLNNTDTYQVEIIGTFPAIYFNNTGDKDKILTVEQWGDIAWTSMEAAFWDCGNLTVPATDAPDLSSVTSMLNMFRYATSFNQSINHWDVSNVTDMGYLFYFASNFNQPLNSWITSGVLDMQFMFRSANTFNQDIGNWNVSSVANMASMFYANSSFSQDLNLWNVSNVLNMNGMFKSSAYNSNISTWNVANVTDMAEMFLQSSFNQDINNWNVGKVMDMSQMFYNNIVFNQPLDNWRPALVTDMGEMFLLAESFNQDIDNWTVGSVIYMDDMFALAYDFNGIVSSWDVSKVIDMSGMFWDTSFDQDVSGWDVSKVTNMGTMFRDCYFDQDISNWDVSKVTNMSSMFRGTPFNQSLGNWDVSSVTNMTQMLDGTSLSRTNYDATLVGWATLDGGAGETLIPSGISLGAAGLTYCNSETEWTFLDVTQNWTITDAGQVCPFVTTWSTTDNQITIPTTGVAYNYDIVWTNLTNTGVGDGSTTGETSDYTITGLDNGDTYQVEIVGAFPRIYFNAGTEVDKILTIEQWGDINWTSMNSAFYLCSNLTYNAIDSPDLSGVTDLAGMFIGATSFNGDLSTWDVSGITTMNSMFYSAINFNQDLSAWNVSNVLTMIQMFTSATSFNQDLSVWDVSKVTDMRSMFFQASSFNNGGQPLIWGVKTGLVDDMSHMFEDATTFNQDLSGWDLGSVTNMNNMFSGATNFNQNISGWDMSGVTTLYGMFENATSFNQDISGWNVGLASDFDSMFAGATSFNQDIGSWDVSGAYGFWDMFNGASSFDQSLGSWDMTSASYMDNMFDNSGLSIANYDATLIGWASLGSSLDTSLDLGAVGLSYCSGQLAHDFLSGDRGWSIIDAGSDCSATGGVIECDYNALVALYNATDGVNWTNNTNWLSANPVSSWFGVNVVGNRVTQINLPLNNLNGTIPTEIGCFTALTEFVLYENQLSGSIPTELGYLSNLQTLLLGYNQLTGSIPIELGNLTNLEQLELHQNQLTGSIPTELGNLTVLYELNFNNNLLSGSIPVELGNLTALQYLYMYNNQLSGAIPIEIGNLLNLREIDFDNNQLTGSIPDELAALTNLQQFDFGDNPFTAGPIPTWIGNFTNLTWLGLENAQLTGSIPTEIGTLTNLTLIQLDQNQLSGAVPSNFINLINLQTFDLNENQLNSLPDLSSISSIIAFNMFDNFFEFDDIEPNIGITGIIYAPQAQVAVISPINVIEGTVLDITVPVGGSANQYQWVKDNVDVVGQTTDNLMINNVIASDAGTYYLRATSSLVSGLTLRSDNIIVTVNAINSPEIRVYVGADNSGTELTAGQASVIDIGSATQGTDIAFDFSIWNNGTVDLNVSDISFANSTGTFDVNNGITTISAGVLETFTVLLTGGTVGSFTADVVIASNDTDENPFTFPVIGIISGVASPEIEVLVDATNTTSGSSIDLGNTIIGNDISATITINNTGTVDLNISDILFTTGTSYSVVGITPPSVIAASGSTNFAITLSGLTAGTFSDQLTITSDDADETAFTIDFNGEILAAPAPEIVVYLGADNTGSEITNSQTTIIDFGNVVEGADIDQVFTIENTGNADLTIINITLSGTDFSITGAMPSLVAVGATENFTVRLSGAAPGTFDDQITITSDDADEVNFAFNITGTINSTVPSEPEFELFIGNDNTGTAITNNQSAAIDFGASTTGTDISMSFTIENIGDVDLEVSDISSSGSTFLILNPPTIVTSGNASSFEITMSARSTGEFTETITITNNDSDESNFQFTVTGTVEGAIIKDGDDTSGGVVIDNQDVDLGTTELNVDIDHTFVIENLSPTDRLLVDSITVDNPIFVVLEFSSEVPPGDFIQFTIRLNARDIGVYSTNVNVYTSLNDFSFVLNGEVVANAPPDLNVYNVVTPNGDGIHDFFKIGNLDYYENNKVTIFNRWGGKVFETDKYDNLTNRFEGISNQGGSGELDTGNYYYVIDKGDGSKPQNGFIFLKR